MRTVLLAHNGIGLGHLVRMTRIAHALRELDGRPVFFSQCPPSATASLPYPTAHVPSLLAASPAKRAALAEDLTAYLEMGNEPSVLVEDTHPSQLTLSPSINRALIVRPVSWDYLCRLQIDHRHTYQAFFLADSPSSPTWPYTEEETATIRGWPRWHIVGPVYRRPAPAEIALVRQKLGVKDDAPICVFTMGGGGQHPEGSDVASFTKAAVEMGEALRARDPRARLVFVRGPLFPKGERLPSIFEVIEQEPDMHALLSAARCAVLRPGFNTTWECLAAGTMMHPVLGTSYEEPIEVRLQRMRSRGLLPIDPVEAWSDASLRNEYKARCEALEVEHAGAERRIAEGLVDLAHRRRVRPGVKRTPLRVLLLTINGIGIGHLVRSARIAQTLRDAGHECFLLLESGGTHGVNDELNPDGFPCQGATIPRITNRANPESNVLTELESYLHEFDPDVVVYDGHVPMEAAPASIGGLRWRYVLALHSAPSPRVLSLLGTRADADFSLLLHGEAEYDALYGAEAPRAALPPNVALAGGPIQRGPALRTQSYHRQVPSQPFLLVLFGGGGEHRGKKDTLLMSRMLGDVAEHVFRELGWQTVCSTGPLFDGSIHPEHPALTSHSYIHNIDAFIAAAEMVVARPGFNLAREIIGRNRVVFLKTYQFEEALEQQLAYYARVPDVRFAECEPAAVIAAIEELRQRREPVAPVSFGDGLGAVIEHITKADRETNGLEAMRELTASFHAPPSISIRIDDVESLDGMTGRCVRDLLAMSLDMSLEIIPYTNRLSGAALDAVDPDGRIEVSQHGYSHLPRRWPLGGRGELSVNADSPAAWETDDLKRGRETMIATFGERFAGGFSTPFDALPAWLPAVWARLGGRYLSYIWHRPRGVPLPVVHVGVDPWNWFRKRRFSAGEIYRMTAEALARRGELGLVLHPERFSDDDWRLLRRLLSTLLEAGAKSTPLRRLAALQSERIIVGNHRLYAASSR